MPAIRTTSPEWGAWIMRPLPTYRPTWWTGLPPNTRSPGWSWSALMRWLMLNCERDECGRDFPPAAHAYMVRPEQSKPFPGVAPPQRYGTPSWDFAAAMAAA